MKAIASGVFQSRRFSRVGETFCYLKLAANPEEWSAMMLGESIDRVLRRFKVGCCVWSGEGPATDYVGLALADVEHAMTILRAFLQKINVERQSWLLFLDNDLDHEWLGVRPDTPAPKLPVAGPLGG